MSRDPEFLLEATTETDPEVLSQKTRKVPVVPVGQLREGDVLLSRGIGWLSDLIAGVDGGSYSHAAYYDGVLIIQATKKGVKQMPAQLVQGAQSFVDAYRFRTPASLNFGAPPNLDPAPVTGLAKGSLNKPFAYSDLFGALVVLTVRRLAPGNWKPEWEAALRLAMLAEKANPFAPNAEKVTCTELVTRCFWGATQNGKLLDYGIRVRFSRARSFHFESTQKALQSSSYIALQNEAAELLALMRPEFAPTEAVSSHSIAAIAPGGFAYAGRELPAPHVTPFDLEHSESLEYLGRVWTAP